jgi:hypothetical protein
MHRPASLTPHPSSSLPPLLQCRRSSRGAKLVSAMAAQTAAMAAQTAEVLSVLRAHCAFDAPSAAPPSDTDEARRKPKSKSGTSRGDADSSRPSRSGSSHGDSARPRNGVDGPRHQRSGPGVPTGTPSGPAVTPMHSPPRSGSSHGSSVRPRGGGAPPRGRSAKGSSGHARGGSDDSSSSSGGPDDEPPGDSVNHPPVAALGGAPGAHSSLTFYVLADTEPIVATKALARLGWNVTFLGFEARGKLTAPGIKEAFPLFLAANGDYYLDLVADPRLPVGMLNIAGADVAHRGLQRYFFLIDSGADCSLMDSTMAAALLTATHHPGIGITGATGNSVGTIDSGTLDLAFFIGGRLLSRPMGGPGATVFHMPANARVRTGRLCAFSPIGSPPRWLASASTLAPRRL